MSPLPKFPPPVFLDFNIVPGKKAKKVLPFCLAAAVIQFPKTDVQESDSGSRKQLDPIRVPKMLFEFLEGCLHAVSMVLFELNRS
jgi:hypothetical protein